MSGARLWRDVGAMGAELIMGNGTYSSPVAEVVRTPDGVFRGRLLDYPLPDSWFGEWSTMEEARAAVEARLEAEGR